MGRLARPSLMLGALLSLLLCSSEARHNAWPTRRPVAVRSASSAAASCNISSGTWTGFFPGPLNDRYLISPAPQYGPEGYSVLNVGGSGGWSFGVLTLSPDNATATVVLDGAVALDGNVSDGCATITWNNTSVWRKVDTSIKLVHLLFM
jgi:hypothetical protein